MPQELKVLIVEDAPADAELAMTALHKMWPAASYQRVETEESFRAGLAWQPDVIIADYEVPGFGAVAALRILEELDSDTPLIVFTGAVSEETVVQCMRLGAADYLLKDRLTRLGTAVANALTMRNERRQKQHTEAEQHRLAELNSAILDSLPAYIALLDRDGCIVATNEAWRSAMVTGTFSDGSCSIGSNYIDHCLQMSQTPERDTQGIAQGLREVLSGSRESFSTEYASHLPGEQRWFRMVVTPVPRGGAVVMHINVTDRRLVEEQLKINANALRHLTEAVVVTDAELHVVTVNQAFKGITGYVSSDILNRPITDLMTHASRASLMPEIRSAVVRRGTWKGEIQCRRKNGELFPALFSFSAVRSDSGALQNFTAVFTDLSSVREVERRVEYLSQHDTLTGLPNRSGVAERLRAALGECNVDTGAPALLFIELDRFKMVNDTLGHPVGDQLLREVAKRLSQAKGANDMLARIGGDEFVMLMPQLHSIAEAGSAAEQIRIALERPFVIEQQDIFITASVGVSCFPRDGGDFESLLRAAEAAVYRAKQSGRNAVAFFSADMDVAAQERFALQNGFSQALARGEFLLEYQPTIDLHSSVVTGVEALIRWRHPRFGVIPPSRFISLAEDTGHIIPISDWVLRTACNQAKRWINAGWSRASIAVNLSVRQFAQPDLAARIADILESTGLSPGRIRLEVTESIVMDDPVSAAAILERLTRMGIQIALDDFGTGYSSLGYLKRFRLGCLKVDRSFVSGTPGDSGDESIVHAVVALGKTLGMKIVAEGVETRAQSQFLRSAGCDDGQGFFYARPVPTDQVLKLVTAIPQQHSGDGLTQSDLLR